MRCTLLGAARVQSVEITLDPDARCPLLVNFGSSCIEVLLESLEMFLGALVFRLAKFGAMAVHVAFCSRLFQDIGGSGLGEAGVRYALLMFANGGVHELLGETEVELFPSMILESLAKMGDLGLEELDFLLKSGGPMVSLDGGSACSSAMTKSACSSAMTKPSRRPSDPRERL